MKEHIHKVGGLEYLIRLWRDGSGWSYTVWQGRSAKRVCEGWTAGNARDGRAEALANLQAALAARAEDAVDAGLIAQRERVIREEPPGPEREARLAMIDRFLRAR